MTLRALTTVLATVLTFFGTTAALVTQSTQATPAEAAPFVGDWTLALSGPNGAAAFDLTVKVDNGKVVGEIKGTETAAQAVSSIWMAAKTMKLGYSFDYQGMAIDALVSLTRAPDGQVAAQIDFASGAYVATGTATKREPAKK